MSNSTARPATAATTTSDIAALAHIGELAVAAHQAHGAWSSGRNGGVGYRGDGGMRDLEKKKGEAERRLREAIRHFIHETS